MRAAFLAACFLFGFRSSFLQPWPFMRDAIRAVINNSVRIMRERAGQASRQRATINIRQSRRNSFQFGASEARSTIKKRGGFGYSINNKLLS